MREMGNQLFVLVGIALSCYLLYLLSPMLTPFIFGALLAYLINPVVLRLDKIGMPHSLSVILVFTAMIMLLSLFVLMFIPILEQQASAFMELLPSIWSWVEETLLPWIRQYATIKPETIKSALSTALPKTGWFFSTLAEWLVNIVLIPVVLFYMLRDWKKILHNVQQVLPKPIKQTTIQLTSECDSVLSAFFRGQFLVMLALSMIYGIGLSLLGLKVGLMIGLIGGMLSIIPYLGSGFVLVFGSLSAFLQFGDWHSVLGVLVIYAIGQVIESYVLTPYLIGERIGLHPVMVIFAIMAGGTLCGFFGVLVALPVAAVLKVMLKHALSREWSTR